MDTQLPNSQQQKGDKKKMVTRAISMDKDLWQRARIKAGMFGSLSKIIRKFLYYWLKGEIDIDKFPDIED